MIFTFDFFEIVELNFSSILVLFSLWNRLNVFWQWFSNFAQFSKISSLHRWNSFSIGSDSLKALSNQHWQYFLGWRKRSKNDIKDLKLVFFATGDKPDVADKTARLYLDNGYDYDKLKNSLNSEIDFAGDLNSSSEMKLHLATVLIKKVLSKLEN